VIRLDDVDLSLAGTDVLDGVSLSVERGEFVALVGPNGAGKTTLLRAIQGILDPDAGRVTLDGERVSDLSASAASRRVATVPQDTHVGFSFTAEQVVEMGRTPHRSRFDWTDDTGTVRAAMYRTETLALRDRAVDSLSGGERQRVILARALAQEPNGLLLDEPTANLDINHQIQVLELVSDLVREGRAAFAAIHDLDLAARFCDRLLLLSDGRVRARGPPGRVLADPALADAFDTETAVSRDRITGTHRITALPDRPDRSGQVHVVGGGASGVAAVRALWRAGYEVTLGPVPEGDVAASLAADLGLRTVTVPAFEQPADTERAAARDLARAADILVVADHDTTAGVVADRADEVPRVRANFGDSGLRRTAGDGGETRVVESEADLLTAVDTQISN
jgi:ABC-type cobalamin/Fe3+-siderophores transport systems, ATPase components